MGQNVFVSGGTGYLGVELNRLLYARGHSIQALARPGSESKIPTGCEIVRGNALDASTFLHALSAGDTFVHLVGVAHPAPWKGTQFRAVDLPALRASAEAAVKARVGHFVFVSVAHPAPAMHAYIAVRKECEAILVSSGLDVTILRPWYVLGPGHRWPHVLRPFYALAERVPAWRPGALRLGLVTRRQMLNALVNAVEHPARGIRVEEVPRIRTAELSAATFAPPADPRAVSAALSIAPGSGPAAASPTSARMRG